MSVINLNYRYMLLISTKFVRTSQGKKGIVGEVYRHLTCYALEMRIVFVEKGIRYRFIIIKITISSIVIGLKSSLSTNSLAKLLSDSLLLDSLLSNSSISQSHSKL